MTPNIEAVEVNMKLIFDSGKCTGCKICQLACSARHQGVFNPEKAHLKVIDHYTRTGREIELRSCTSCLQCTETCPVEAISFNGKWLVVDDSLCSGCGECVEACPEGIIFLDDRSIASVPNFCEGSPYCVERCPYGAISIGEAVS